MKLQDPIFTFGHMFGIPGGVLPDYAGDLGPSGLYQWAGLMDPRFTPAQKDACTPGSIPVFMDSIDVVMCDGTPSALAANNIAAAQALAAGAMTLANTQTRAACVGIPVVPFGAAAPVTCMALEGGFDVGNVTSGSKNIVVTAGVRKRLFAGQSLIIGGVGNAAGTLPLITTVVSATGTTLVVADAPAKTNAAAPMFQGNLVNPYFQQSGQLATGVLVAMLGPLNTALAFDPTAAICRGVQVVSSNAGDTTQTIRVDGYDVFHQPMSETIALNGVTPVLGKKAFKYIKQIVGSAVSAGNITVGTTDIFGFNRRTLMWEDLRVFYNGLQVVAASTGFVAADITDPATATTGDVRGTYAVQSASDGTKRLRMTTQIQPGALQLLRPDNLEPFFGITQFAA